MRLVSSCTIASVLLLAAIPGLASPRVHRGPTSPRSLRTKVVAKPAAVRAIAPERVTQIQTALISAGYLSGSPTGNWDTETQAAMTRLQADNGWQTRLIPDSRAIIKLGLGPNSTVATTAEPNETNNTGEAAPAPSVVSQP